MSPAPSKAALVSILGSLAMMGPLTIDMYLPALPAVVADYQTTASHVQLSLTFYLIGLALGQLLAGPISDVRGRRAPILAGLALYALCSLLCAFSPNVWWLIFLRGLQGFAGAAGMVVSRAVVRDLFAGTELTKFFTLLMMVNGAGPIIAPIIGGQLLRFTSWRGVFVVLCGVGIVMFFTVLFALRETLPVHRRSHGGIANTLITFRSLLRDRVFMGYALSSGFVTAALFAYLSGSSFVLQNIYGISPQTYGLIFAVNGFASAPEQSELSRQRRSASRGIIAAFRRRHFTASRSRQRPYCASFRNSDRGGFNRFGALLCVPDQTGSEQTEKCS